MKKKNAVFEDIITTISRYFVVLVVIVIACIALSGIRFVKSGEVAVVLRFGKLVGSTYEEQVHEPGILLAFPYIIDEVVTVPTGTVMERVVTTHYTEGNMSTINNNGYVITGDNNMALMKVSVKYSITDPVEYALIVKDAEKIIDACVSNAMLEKAIYTKFDEILTSGKEEYNKAVLESAQQSLDDNSVGVTISTIEFISVAPPAEVNAAYVAVNQATIEADSILNAAQQEATRIEQDGQAAANKIVSDAEALYSQKTAAANADLAEFWGTVEEYESSYTSRALVRTRIRNEKITAAVSKIGKVITVKDGNSHIVIN